MVEDPDLNLGWLPPSLRVTGDAGKSLNLILHFFVYKKGIISLVVRIKCDKVVCALGPW